MSFLILTLANKGNDIANVSLFQAYSTRIVSQYMSEIGFETGCNLADLRFLGWPAHLRASRLTQSLCDAQIGRWTLSLDASAQYRTRSSLTLKAL